MDYKKFNLFFKAIKIKGIKIRNANGMLPEVYELKIKGYTILAESYGGGYSENIVVLYNDKRIYEVIDDYHKGIVVEKDTGDISIEKLEELLVD